MTRNLYEVVTGEVAFGSSFVPHDPVNLDFPDDGMTRQEFAEECDINTLMARYQKTGLLPQNPDRRPIFGDFSDLPTYQEAMEVIMTANAAFESLPAVVRRQFDNDPAAFVAFAEDPENVEQMRLWGLAEAVKPLDAPEVPEAAPAASDAPAAS